MKLIDLTWTKCGAQLQVNGELKKCMCQFCGNEMLIDDETVHHQIDNAFQAGYEAELGRQQALSDLARQQQQLAQQRMAEQNRMMAEMQAKIEKGKKRRNKYGLVAVFSAWTARILVSAACSYPKYFLPLIVTALILIAVSIIFLCKGKDLPKSTYFKVNKDFTIYFIIFSFIILYTHLSTHLIYL